jgi:hypothetical protein
MGTAVPQWLRTARCYVVDQARRRCDMLPLRGPEMRPVRRHVRGSMGVIDKVRRGATCVAATEPRRGLMCDEGVDCSLRTCDGILQ